MSLNNINPMLLIDFYKATHDLMLPKNMTKSVSYYTSRMSRIKRWDKAVFFGLQGTCKEYLIKYFNENFFGWPIDNILEDYKRILDNTLGPKAYDATKIEKLHSLGYLPIEILAVPVDDWILLGTSGNNEIDDKIQLLREYGMHKQSMPKIFDPYINWPDEVPF